MSNKNGPQGKYDEVEYSEELADTEDKEAMQRMDAADRRAKTKQKKNK
jgi:hypothetical protein